MSGSPPKTSTKLASMSCDTLVSLPTLRCADPRPGTTGGLLLGSASSAMRSAIMRATDSASSGFSRATSLMDGMGPFRNVCVRWNMNADPVTIISISSSGAICTLSEYFSDRRSRQES